MWEENQFYKDIFFFISISNQWIAQPQFSIQHLRYQTVALHFPRALLRSPSSPPGMKGSREFVWISFTRSWPCWLRSSCRSSLAPWRRSPRIPRQCAERGCTTFSCGSRTTTGAKQPSDTWEPAGVLLLWLCALLMGVVFFQRWREHAGQHFCGSFKCSQRETTSGTLWWKPRPSVSANCSPSITGGIHCTSTQCIWMLLLVFINNQIITLAGQHFKAERSAAGT